MTDRELMQQALDLLDDINQCSLPPTGIPLPAEIDHVMEDLRARLAKPEQEPVAWWHDMGDVVDLNVSGRGVPLYTAPPKREWQGLTDEEIEKLVYDIRSQTTGVVAVAHVARAIEAKLKQKNE